MRTRDEIKADQRAKQRVERILKLTEQRKKSQPVLLDRQTFDDCRALAKELRETTAGVVRYLVRYAIEGLKREAAKPEKKVAKKAS